MNDKLEKDTINDKSNNRWMLLTGFLLMLVAVIYQISVIVGGAFHDFCAAAVTWVLLGVALACSVVYLNEEKYKNNM